MCPNTRLINLFPPPPLTAQVQRDVFQDELAREQEEAQRLQGLLQELKAVPRVSTLNLRHVWVRV